VRVVLGSSGLQTTRCRRRKASALPGRRRRNTDARHPPPSPDEANGAHSFSPVTGCLTELGQNTDRRGNRRMKRTGSRGRMKSTSRHPRPQTAAIHCKQRRQGGGGARKYRRSQRASITARATPLTGGSAWWALAPEVRGHRRHGLRHSGQDENERSKGDDRSISWPGSRDERNQRVASVARCATA
jgi:hypothetical protein